MSRVKRGFVNVVTRIAAILYVIANKGTVDPSHTSATCANDEWTYYNDRPNGTEFNDFNFGRDYDELEGGELTYVVHVNDCNT